MAKRIPMIDGDEMDAMTPARKIQKWRAGERRRIKTKYRRRERRKAHAEMRRAKIELSDDRENG